MNKAGKGTHQWRALKHFWKLILTPARQLRYDNYWSRRNFSYTQLTDVEVIHRLLAFDRDLSQAYNYYQSLTLAVSHRDRGELNQLLSQKWTSLPGPLQRVQRTLPIHQSEIINSFKCPKYTNGPVEGTNNKIKVIKRTAYGFRNFFNLSCSPYLIHILPSTGTIKKQLMPNSRHELLEKLILFSHQYFLTKSQTYSIFSSVLLLIIC